MPRPKSKKIVSSYAKAQPAHSHVDEPPARRGSAAREDEAKQLRSSRRELRRPSLKAASRPRAAEPAADALEMSGALGASDSLRARPELRSAQQSQRNRIEGHGGTRQTSRQPAAIVASRTRDDDSSQHASSTSTRQKTGGQPASEGKEQSASRLSVTAGDIPREASQERRSPVSPAAPSPALPPSALKGQNTPSFVSIANFKRRPRQPSILRMVQKSIANQSENEAEYDGSGDDTTLLSLRDVPVVDPAVSPLAVSQASSSARKRKRSSFENEDQSLVPSFARRPRYEPAALPSDPAELDIEEHPEQDTNAPAHNAELEVSNSEAGTPHMTNSSDLRTRTTPDAQISASSKRPRRSTHKTIRRMPVDESIGTTATSPISSPPSSPAKRGTIPEPPTSKHSKREKRQHKPLQITDAELRALLPRRRRRIQPNRTTNGFQILSTSPSAEDTANEDDDLDELQRPQRQRRATTKAVHVKAKHRKGMLGAHKGTSRANVRSTTLSRATSQQKANTYGRSAPPLDKENALDEDVDFEVLHEDEEDEDIVLVGREDVAGAVKSRELADAAKKFAEVDDWELEFESCDVGGGSSSPWR